jgi:hypothetical protein
LFIITVLSIVTDTGHCEVIRSSVWLLRFTVPKYIKFPRNNSVKGHNKKMWSYPTKKIVRLNHCSAWKGYRYSKASRNRKEITLLCEICKNLAICRNEIILSDASVNICPTCLNHGLLHFPKWVWRQPHEKACTFS